MSIEDIILDHDRRGVAELRPHLPSDFCDQAAALVLENPGTAMIVTGFYILAAGATETDGPPGAAVIGNALQTIGYKVVYVTDRYTASVMGAIAAPDSRTVDFPIADETASRVFAEELLSELNPSVLIAIERCGLTNEGLYRNMRGGDISAYNAKTDYLFTGHPASVGIGDGGNEVGMGNLASIIPTVPTLVRLPCVTKTSKLVITSVSNWGGYGLVAAISRRRGRNLLPTIEAEQEMVKRIVDLGAVDGMSQQAEYKVDGFTLEENSQTLRALHELLADEGVSP
jgi:hypothetical protein